MKLIYSLSLIAFPAAMLLTACSGNKTEAKKEATVVVQEVKKPVVIGNETSLLLKDLKENGDYVNSNVFPSLIKASVVHESLYKNIHVIDLRSSKQFSEGHIKGSVNKRFEDLPAYFETKIKPFEFDKIVIVCDDGQISSYTTCLLRLMGYGNVYAMRWGMSSWNLKYAETGWLRDVNSKYEASLETASNEKSTPDKLPELNTGLNAGPEIGVARFKKLFEEGTGSVLTTADEVFGNPQKYYIINLERKDKYESGHIPGALRYKPESFLGVTDEMATIPTDKQVVVYCGTGHNSGFATAYLRLFGYNATTLRYGNNGFMHDQMIKQKIALSWGPFTKEDVNNFEVIR
jgi:rhodanese-related sulfurtransferase